MDKQEIIKDGVSEIIKDNGLVVSNDEQYNNIHRAVLLKTEKLVTAVHLVTSLIDTREKIRWGLRSAAVDSISDLYLLTRTLPGARSFVSDKILKKIDYIVSLLGVGATGSLISQMNYSILREEYLKLRDVLVKFQLMNGSESFVLPDNFFGSDIKDIENMSVTKRIGIVKRTSLQNVGLEMKKDRSIEHRGAGKTSRQDMIVRAMKDSVMYTIKDIMSQVSLVDSSVDCSEKTIQRDLLALVANGILNKQGERRWSRYFKMVVS